MCIYIYICIDSVVCLSLISIYLGRCSWSQALRQEGRRRWDTKTGHWVDDFVDLAEEESKAKKLSGSMVGSGSNIQTAIENGHRNSEFPMKNCDFS